MRILALGGRAGERAGSVNIENDLEKILSRILVFCCPTSTRELTKGVRGVTIGAIGSCSDCSTNPLRQVATERPGEEKPSPVEEANRLAEESREIDTSGARDQRVNPTETAAKAGISQTLAQAAQVNALRDGGAAATTEAGEADQRASAAAPVERQPAAQAYQATEAAEAADSEYPNRGGVLDFQV